MLQRCYAVRKVVAGFAVLDQKDKLLAWLASEPDAEDLARRLNGETMVETKKGQGNWTNKRAGQGFDWKRPATFAKEKR